MSAKKFELKKFTREEWLVMDSQTLEDQLGGRNKECPSCCIPMPVALFSAVRRIEKAEKRDRHSYKSAHRFRHFCKNWKGGKRDD